MNDAEKRLQWEMLDEIRPLFRPGGRVGTGARNHCAHGKNAFIETILDWRPFEYYTVELPMAIQSRCIEPVQDGTRLKIHIKLKMPLPRGMTRPFARFMFKQFKAEEQFKKMVQLINTQTVFDKPPM